MDRKLNDIANLMRDIYVSNNSDLTQNEFAEQAVRTAILEIINDKEIDVYNYNKHLLEIIEIINSIFHKDCSQLFQYECNKLHLYMLMDTFLKEKMTVSEFILEITKLPFNKNKFKNKATKVKVTKCKRR